MKKLIALFAISAFIIFSCSKNNISRPEGPDNIVDSVAGKWVKTILDSTTDFFDVQVINKRIVYMGDYNGRLWKTTDGGLTWTKRAVPTGKITSLHFLDSLYGFVLSGPFIYITADGGTTWQSRVVSTGTGGSIGTNHLYFINRLTGFVTANTAYRIGIVLKTTDGGVHWRTTHGGDQPHEIYFASAQRGWFADYLGHLYQTNDGGETWVIKSPGSGNNDLHPIYHGLHAADTGTIITGNLNGIMLTKTSTPPLEYSHYWMPGQPYASSCFMLSQTTGYYISGYNYINKFDLANTTTPVVPDTVYQNYARWNAMSFYDSTFGVVCGDFGRVAIMKK